MNGLPAVVETEGGRVVADRIVLAINAWGARFGEIRKSIAVVSGDIVITAQMEEQLEKSGVGVDYKQLENMKGGGLIGGQKKLDANKDGKISGADFEMMGANRKKYGGKITYKMAGGQVVDSSYD